MDDWRHDFPGVAPVAAVVRARIVSVDDPQTNIGRPRIARRGAERLGIDPGERDNHIRIGRTMGGTGS